MKNNIAMRMAAILFIITIISTCEFSSTFAKYVTTGSSSDTEFEEKVNEAIANYSKTYAANTDLSGASAPVISWKWAFEGNNDIYDTMLAMLPSLPTVSLKITTTITQID